MSLSMTLFTFINTWFITLFFVLPFFVRPEEQRTSEGYAAAPKAIRWKKALLYNSAVSILVTAGLFWLTHSHLINLDTILS